MRLPGPIRTTPLNVKSDAIALWGKSFAGSIVLALAISALLFLISVILPFIWFSYPVQSRLEGVGLMLLLSPVVVAPIQIALAPLAILAFRYGYAGWAVALIVGAVVGPLSLWVWDDFNWSPEFLKMGVVMGSCFAVIFWITSGIFSPHSNLKGST